MSNKLTKKQKRDWEIINTTMATTLAAGVKVLQDDFDMSDGDSGAWVLKTAILLNEHLDIDSTGLHELLGEFMVGDGQKQ